MSSPSIFKFTCHLIPNPAPSDFQQPDSLAPWERVRERATNRKVRQIFKFPPSLIIMNPLKLPCHHGFFKSRIAFGQRRGQCNHVLHVHALSGKQHDFMAQARGFEAVVRYQHTRHALPLDFFHQHGNQNIAQIAIQTDKRLVQQGKVAAAQQQAQNAASCWRPTSPKPHLPCRASNTSSTPASRASNAIPRGQKWSSFMSKKSPKLPPANAPAAADASPQACVSDCFQKKISTAAPNSPTPKSSAAT